ncbi:MAG: archaemetzincin [Candidatus Brocadiia bacterium]
MNNGTAPRRSFFRSRAFVIAVAVAGFIAVDILFVAWYLNGQRLDDEYRFLDRYGSPDAPPDIPEPVSKLSKATNGDFYNAVVAALEPLLQYTPNNDEPDESFAAFRAKRRNKPTDERKIFYVQPLGELTAYETRILDTSAEFVKKYFGFTVVRLPVKSISAVAGKYRRSGTYGEQFFTGHLLGKVLLPDVPADAVAVMGITDSDLWPGGSFNFVFGEATFTLRVGVSSLRRMVEDSPKPDDHLVLARTIKLFAHEGGHMFSLLHCSLTPCAMEYPNSLAAHDAATVHLCPCCTAKLCWSLNYAPEDRFAGLAEWFGANGFREEAEFCTKAKEALLAAKIPDPGNGK